MASSFNAKAVHRDGKAELKIGIDSNSKTINGVGDEVLIKNEDGTPAKISIYNVPYIPESASEDNKLVTQDDLKKMMKNINDAITNMQDAMDSLMQLAEIVGITDKEE